MKIKLILFLKISILIFFIFLLFNFGYVIPYISKELYDHYPKFIIFGGLFFIYISFILFIVALYNSYLLIHSFKIYKLSDFHGYPFVNKIRKNSLIINIFLLCALPFFYIMAQIDDAPGIFAFMLFMFSLSLVITASFWLYEHLLLEEKKES